MDENNIKTRQQIKKGRSKQQSTWLIIQLLPLLSLCYRSAVAPLSLRCRSVVAPLSHRYCIAIAPLSLHWFRSCCRYAVVPAIASAITPLLIRYRSVVAPLSLCCRFCPSGAPAVASAVTTLSLLLSCLLSLTVSASRGRIRVTVFIGDCQARVSSSSEGCSTLHKIVKLEAY